MADRERANIEIAKFLRWFNGEFERKEGMSWLVYNKKSDPSWLSVPVELRKSDFPVNVIHCSANRVVEHPYDIREQFKLFKVALAECGYTALGLRARHKLGVLEIIVKHLEVYYCEGVYDEN